MMQSSLSADAAKTCAISQPTFLPWLGWFDLVDQADIMVLLDDVPFSKQSWQQRNRIRTRNGLEFLSVPIRTAGRLGQRILECELSDAGFVPRMLGSLRANYARAPYFTGAIDELAAVLDAATATGRLVELNCALIAWMAPRLGVDTPMIRASTLEAGGRRGEHVAAICARMGATHYLSPAGAEAYLAEDQESFDRRGIAVRIQVYEHPQYRQCAAPFIPFASALDLIFNAGPEAAAIMRSGRRPPRMISKAIAQGEP